MLHRFLIGLIGVGIVVSGGCGSSGGDQSLDVSGFARFTFTRTIEIPNCFAPGDFYSVELVPGNEGMVFNYTVLVAATIQDVTCLAQTEIGECLIAGDLQTRVLEDVEVKDVESKFKQIEISREASDFCGSGNVTVCGQDLFTWDDLSVGTDLCQPVFLSNSLELMTLLEDLRDGPPPAQPESSSGWFFL